ncbi:hypothetical protein OUZ56_011417 [Daphnia magna]|uniref:Uncharacterized protein n=1 Tax=Daphnia magna TaxID=35525 RepID=A0ABQ9Z026_9CRUS|nr:hypothetical protein OUZ56_011417 [Daphnia magna]
MSHQLLCESASSDSDISITPDIFWSNESSDRDLEDLQYFIQERIPRPKVNNYLSVVDQYTDEEFQRNFRMSRPTCESLIQDFADLSLYPKNNNPWLNASSICPGTHSLILMITSTIMYRYPDSLGLREQLMGLDSDIDIRTPAGRLPSACINRKLHTSITLQAICSYDKAFTDVFTDPFDETLIELERDEFGNLIGQEEPDDLK